jgi:hypothetical protein
VLSTVAGSRGGICGISHMRASAPDLALREGGRGTTRAPLARDTVAAQTALALVLSLVQAPAESARTSILVTKPGTS